jgi:hypothetical protein
MKPTDIHTVVCDNGELIYRHITVTAYDADEAIDHATSWFPLDIVEGGRYTKLIGVDRLMSGRFIVTLQSGWNC